MDPFAKTVVPIRIEDEMRSSYMDYSMSVIIGRALPDVRDGLKPVHRRILYAMHREGLHHNHKYSKCAGVVGEVLKKYHPHGDSAVYDALVRMAQPWNLRYVLVDGQGNFGSVDGDPAAAYRYTECRMTRLAGELLADIDKQTVSFSPNFDGETEEPDVLPSRFPNLLVNGADGIAVGMATKIPPHNLREVVDACIALIDQPALDLEELMAFIPGPDFPTGGTIFGRRGIREAYATGRGRVVVRGRTRMEELSNGRRAIVIDEIPYQVNKARLIEQIAELVKDRKLEGIHALRDESDRQGMRVVIELKQDVFEEVLLNNLFKSTALQSTFGVILLAIVNQQPRVLSLKEMLQHYLAHRRDVVLRRTRFELARAMERAHILEGYRKALDHLDEVIQLIRASAGPTEAREGLMAAFGFTEIQAQAILDLRLQRLTGMERERIEEEWREIQETIGRLRAILADEMLLMGVVKQELLEIRATYSDERRTQIIDARGELTLLDLVAEENQVVTLSRLGYVKRCSPAEWRMQRRGGLGRKGMATREEDFVTSLFVANTHDTLLVFTHTGKVVGLPVFDLPEAGRAARGRPIVNLVKVDDGDRIAAVVTVRALDAGEKAGPELLFVTEQGLVKRTPLAAFRNLRTAGLIATQLAEDDALMVVRLVEAGGGQDVVLLSHRGRCIRFAWSEVPELSRNARGNKGMRLDEGDRIVDAVLVPAALDPVDEAGEEEDEEAEGEEEEVDDGLATLLTVTRFGFGKRTAVSAYRRQSRNGKGVLSFRTSEGTGAVLGAVLVEQEDQLLLVTNTGRVIRIAAGEVRRLSRVTKGVKLMRLAEGEELVDLARLVEADDPELGEEAPMEE